jgi:hypothetical protein
MLIDRQVFLDVGGFDQDFFIYYEDVDLGWRLWVLGYRVVLAPKAITYHRLHGDTGGMQNEKRVSITERNTLLAAIKNYEDENLARVLPAALLLMLERAYLMAGIDSQRYKLDSHQVRGTPAAGLVPAGAAGVSQKTRGAGSAWRGGFWQGARRAFRKAWRIGCQQFILHFNQQLEAVPRRTLGPLVGAHDIVELLPRILAKRAEIQGRRRRPDAEILPLFQEPFHPGLDGELYLEAQDRVADLLGIQRLFDNGTAGRNPQPEQMPADDC